LDADLHITEKYLHEVKRWFCISNLKLTGDVGMDLLAYDSRNRNFYQIELGTSSGLPLSTKATTTLDGKSHKNDLDYFARERFDRVEITTYLVALLS
jgi:hypothetical protein